MSDIRYYGNTRVHKLGSITVFESQTPKGYEWLKAWGGTQIEDAYAAHVIRCMLEDGLTVEAGQ